MYLLVPGRFSSPLGTGRRVASWHTTSNYPTTHWYDATSLLSKCLLCNTATRRQQCVPRSYSSSAAVCQRTTAPQLVYTYQVPWHVACFDSPAVLDGKSGSRRCWRTPAMGTETQRWHYIQGQRSSHEGRGHPHRSNLCGKAVLVCLLHCTFRSLLLSV